MSNLEEIENYNEYESPRESFIKPIHIVIAVFLLLYFYALFFGNYSVGVLIDANRLQAALHKEYNDLQNENQQLQRKHFELLQLTPKEDAF